jgi:hypothetical protein
MGYPQKVFYPDYRVKQAIREEVEQHVKEFLDKGGVIKKLEPGESADFGIHDNDYKKVLRAKKII